VMKTQFSKILMILTLALLAKPAFASKCIVSNQLDDPKLAENAQVASQVGGGYQTSLRYTVAQLLNINTVACVDGNVKKIDFAAAVQKITVSDANTADAFPLRPILFNVAHTTTPRDVILGNAVHTQKDNLVVIDSRITQDRPMS